MPHYEDDYEEVGKFVGWVDDFLEATQEDRALSKVCRQYRHGNQWTESEKAILAGRDEPCITSNFIGPKVSSMLGVEVVGRTDPKAIGRNRGSDQSAADAATAMLRYVCGSTDWPKERSICREDLYVSGVMGVSVDVGDLVFGKSGNPPVEITAVRYNRLFWDPYSQRHDFSDAKYFGEYNWIDYEDIKEQYSNEEKVLDILEGCFYNDKYNSTGTASAFDDQYDDIPNFWVSSTGRKRLRLGKVWYKVAEEWYVAVFCCNGFIDGPRVSPYVDKDGSTQPGMVLMSGYVDEDSNQRYGFVKNLLDAQSEVNKRRSKALHLMNVKTVIAEEGAVNDVRDARKEINKASGWITVRPGKNIQFVDHQQQIVDNMQLMGEARAYLEAVGPNAAIVGNVSADTSGVALEKRQRSALLQYGDILERAREFDLAVYRQCWHRITQYWEEQDYINISDDPDEAQYLGINVRTPITVADELVARGMDLGSIQQLVASGQIDPGKLSEVIGEKVENNPASLDLDIILETGPDYKTMTDEQQANIMSLLGQVGPSAPPKLVQAGIEAIITLLPLETRIKKKFIAALKPDPQEQQAAAIQQAQIQQYQAQTAELQLAKLQAEIEKIKADSALVVARIDETQSDSDKKLAQAAVLAKDAQ